MLKAVIFDMDGVLVDSEAIFYEADKVLLNNLGKEFSKEYYKQYVGTTSEYMWTKIIKDYDLDLTVEYMDEEGRRIVRELLEEQGGFLEVPYAGDFVRRLAGVGEVQGDKAMKVTENVAESAQEVCQKSPFLAIASSSSKASIERNMDRMGIRQHFDAIVSGEDMERPKPYPDVFLAAAGALGVKPEECIVIEDSKNGVLAAKAAGMACVGYVNENSGDQDLSKADVLLMGFEEADYDFINMVYCHTFNEPWKVTSTHRLDIVEMSDEDIKIFHELLKKEDIREVTGLSHNEYNATLGDDTYMSAYRKNMYKFYGYGMWAIKIKDNGETIGFAGVDENMRLSYIISEPYRRKGYCTEALKAIIDYMEMTTEEDIFCNISEENTASIKVAEKMGFIKFENSWRKRNVR